MEERKKYVPLGCDEIECRVGTANQSGVSILLYKNARVDMQRMDEMFGPENWCRKHEVINNNLYCTVGVRYGMEWVYKQDVGVESNTEKEKGEASDAFKRACVNWGIGRELYTAPFIWITLQDSEWRTAANGKKQPIARFSVKAIEYRLTQRGWAISHLVIVDGKGNERYTFGMSEMMEKEIADAMIEIKAAKSVEDLTKVWNKHAALKGIDVYKNAVAERGNELKKTA